MPFYSNKGAVFFSGHIEFSVPFAPFTYISGIVHISKGPRLSSRDYPIFYYFCFNSAWLKLAQSFEV